jgi:hypothetical protein
MLVSHSGRAEVRRDKRNMRPESQINVARRNERSYAMTLYAYSHSNEYTSTLNYAGNVEGGVSCAVHVIASTPYVVKRKCEGGVE